MRYFLKLTATVTSTETGTLTWSSADTSVAEIDNTGAVTIKKVGSTPITAKFESDTTIREATMTLTVKPKALKITAKDANKPYDGSALTQPEADFDGLVGSDSLTVVMTADSTITECGTKPNVIATVDGVAVTTGTETVVGNYKVTTANGTLTVKANDAEITLTAPSDSKTYDGAPLTCDGNDDKKVTATGLPNGFTVEATASGSATNVGDAGVNTVNDGYVIRNAAGEDKTANFTNVKRATGALTINQKSIKGATVTFSPTELTYNSAEQSVTVAGVALDGVTLTEDTDFEVSGDLKGTGAKEYSATVTGKGNYIVSGKKTFGIARAPLTVAAELKSKKEGEADPALTYTVTGLIGNDKLTGALARQPGEAPGSYGITQGSLAAPSDNYTLSFTGSTLIIYAKGGGTGGGGLGDDSDSDISVLATLRPGADDTSLEVDWISLINADGFDSFFTVCGPENVYQVIKSVKTSDLLDYNITGLNKGKCYKAYVQARRGTEDNKTYVGKPSPKIHAIVGGSNKTRCNAKKVKVKKSAMTLKIGAKKKKIKASVTRSVQGKKVLKHVKKFRYFSTNRKVAIVGASGKLKPVGAGTCTIFVLANNGVFKEVTVTVK